MKLETTLPSVPAHAEVDYTFSVKFHFNVTPFVARQKINNYLLTNVGHMLSADEPNTLLMHNGAFWKVPVFCAYPEFKRREHLGDLAVNVESGEIDFAKSTFASSADIEARADAIYNSLATLSTGV